MRKTIALVALVAFGAIGVASVSAGQSATSLTVKLKEFKVIPATKTAKAGKVTFVVSNIGKINHELIVVKTDVPPGKLEENAKHRVSEKGAVGEVEVHHGQTRKLTLTLKPGKYQLFCNLAAHYSAGQYTGFVVK